MSSSLPNLSDYIRGLPKTIDLVKAEPQTEVTVVMGNESCDLDSAVCALTLAHHLSASCLALPFFNIPKEDLALHTEVIFCIGKDLTEFIPTRSDLDLSTLGALRVVLVDHHVMLKQDQDLRSKITEVIDHRHFIGEAAGLPENCPTRIEMVGSCSTLVGERLLSENYKDAFGLELIRNTIIVDTVNLLPAAKKVTPLDVSILEKIEETIPSLKSREAVHASVMEAKCSIEGFTVVQLFRKDLKIVAFPNEIIAAVPSILRTATDILEEDNVTQTFDDFCLQQKADILIVIGRDKGVKVKDLLLYSPAKSGEKGEARIAKITEALLSHAQDGFQITKKLSNLIHLNRDRAFSRKILLPIMQSVHDQ